MATASTTTQAVIRTANASTHAFQPSRDLQTQRGSTSQLTSSLPGSSSITSEAQYWSRRFGLGSMSSSSRTSTAKFSHFRQLSLQAGSAAAVHQLVFGPAAFTKCQPLAVVSGPRVRLYGTQPQSSFHRHLAKHNTKPPVSPILADRQVPTGGHLALAAAYRNDGRLLAVGTAQGQIRIADATTRATLSTLQLAAPLPVRAVHWFRNGQHIFVAGDDATATVHALHHSLKPPNETASSQSSSSSSAILTLKGHGDVIRSAQLWQAASKGQQQKWPHHRALAVTGSYDHTVRIWNVDLDVDVNNSDNNINSNSDRCIAVLDHGAPVEALCLMPAAADAPVPVWVLSAGGTNIRVWNPVTGRCVAHHTVHHRKTITTLLAVPRVRRTNENASSSGGGAVPTEPPPLRVVSAGLDGLLRIHRWDGTSGKLEHLHGIRLTTEGSNNEPFAIASMAVDRTGDRLALGSVDGTVWVRQAGPALVPHKRTREPRAGTYAFFRRGLNADPIASSTSDFVVQAYGKKRKLGPADIALKQFRYGDALDEALATRMPSTVVAVLEELGKRRGLAVALANRDEESLEPILSFLCRYIARPRFAALLIGVAHQLLDIYSAVAFVGQSEVMDELLDKLRRQLQEEIRAQKGLLRVAGQLDAILAAVERRQEDDDDEGGDEGVQYVETSFSS